MSRHLVANWCRINSILCNTHLRIFDRGCVIAEFIFALMPMTTTLVHFYTEKCFVKFCVQLFSKKIIKDIYFLYFSYKNELKQYTPKLVLPNLIIELSEEFQDERTSLLFLLSETKSHHRMLSHLNHLKLYRSAFNV